MPRFAVIDTNVIVSALLSGNEASATSIILEKVFNGEIIPVYSKAIVDEYKNVLFRDKFGFNKDVVNGLLLSFCSFGKMVNPKHTETDIPDKSDLPFLEAAFETIKEGGYLVTGNIKHYPGYSFVVTPREYINNLEKEAAIKWLADELDKGIKSAEEEGWLSEKDIRELLDAKWKSD